MLVTTPYGTSGDSGPATSPTSVTRWSLPSAPPPDPLPAALGSPSTARASPALGRELRRHSCRLHPNDTHHPHGGQPTRLYRSGGYHRDHRRRPQRDRTGRSLHLRGRAGGGLDLPERRIDSWRHCHHGDRDRVHLGLDGQLRHYGCHLNELCQCELAHCHQPCGYRCGWRDRDDSRGCQCSQQLRPLHLWVGPGSDRDNSQVGTPGWVHGRFYLGYQLCRGLDGRLWLESGILSDGQERHLDRCHHSFGSRWFGRRDSYHHVRHQHRRRC